jgi:hypothetical protein
MNLDNRFRYQYRYNPTAYGNQEHTYEVTGRDGAIHFHVSVPGDDLSPYHDEIGGLEIHRRTCPHDENRPPSHHNCPLLGGICWRDGTSLYATDALIPRWKLDFPNHDAIFGWLIAEFCRCFPETA